MLTCKTFSCSKKDKKGGKEIKETKQKQGNKKEEGKK